MTTIADGYYTNYWANASDRGGREFLNNLTAWQWSVNDPDLCDHGGHAPTYFIYGRVPSTRRFRPFFPHFTFHEVVSHPWCILPHRHDTTLGMLFKLMKLCFHNGRRHVRTDAPRQLDGEGLGVLPAGGVQRHRRRLSCEFLRNDVACLHQTTSQNLVVFLT